MINSQYKQQIDASAEREARALSQQGRYTQPKRLRYITDSYNQQEFNKLFIANKYKDENYVS